MPKTFPKKLRVFLCHAEEDKQKVRKLCQRLEKDGFDVWLDEKNLLAGQDWKFEIKKGIRNADAIIFCLSTISVAKEGYVQVEIQEALEFAKEKPEGTISIIPLRLDNCKVPLNIQKWHWENYFTNKGYEKLIKALNARKKDLETKQIVIQSVHHFDLSNLSNKKCKLFIDTLKTKVAPSLSTLIAPKTRLSLGSDFYRFITTNHPVEEWIQSMEKNIKEMGHQKTSTELWVVSGGYGAGKSHSKGYIFASTRRIRSVKFLELDLVNVLHAYQKPENNNIFSLILLEGREFLSDLYDELRKKKDINLPIEETLRESVVDDEFIDTFCEFGKNN